MKVEEVEEDRICFLIRFSFFFLCFFFFFNSLKGELGHCLSSAAVHANREEDERKRKKKMGTNNEDAVD